MLQKATKQYPNIAFATTENTNFEQKNTKKTSAPGDTIYPKGRVSYKFQNVKELYII